MSSPKISIIMPNFNGEKYLELSIKSFLAQKYNNKELIIIDGKSTDNSHKIIKKYSKPNNNIVWLNKKDEGISDAINLGIKQSTGEIIGYLGSDDFLYRNIFDEISFNYNFVNFDAIYFDSISYFVKKNKILLRKCPDLEINRSNLIKFSTIVGLQNIYFKRHIFDNYRFDTSIKMAMDLDLLFKISNNKYLFYYIDKVASINMQDKNISTKMAKLQEIEVIDIIKRHAKSPKEKLYWLIRKIKILKKFEDKLKKFLG